jgi:hypothetical protein
MFFFENKNLEKGIQQTKFVECLKNTMNMQDGNNVLKLPWDNYQKILSDSIEKSLDGFKTCTSSHDIPLEGLKGNFCWLVNNGSFHSLGGSLYFNEEDLAANAEFDPEGKNTHFELFKEIVKNLKEEKINEKEIEQINSIFSCFTIYKTIENIKVSNEIANAGIAVGYSDGPEVILGYFKNKEFISDFKITEH